MSSLPAAVVTAAQCLGAVGDTWLRELPEVVAGLERDWEVTVGAVLPGGNTAYVAEGQTTGGRKVVLKVALPPGVEGFASLAQEVAGLGAAEGDPFVALLAHDPTRSALLLERLGPSLASRNLSPSEERRVIAATLQRGWRPVAASSLPKGTAKVDWLTDFVRRSWDNLGRPCEREAVADAVAAAERRAAGDRDAVLVHGDAHPGNVLAVPGQPGRYRLIDPDPMASEPAHDLGVVLRAELTDPIGGARQLADLTDMAVQAIWDWSVVERVSTGLFLLRLGHEHESRRWLAAAERWAGTRP